jgi:uncharacterized membrane protein YidH (DUF202 family)
MGFYASVLIIFIVLVSKRLVAMSVDEFTRSSDVEPGLRRFKPPLVIFAVVLVVATVVFWAALVMQRCQHAGDWPAG